MIFELQEYELSELVEIKYGKNQKKVQNDNGKYPILGTGGVMGYATEYLYDKPSVLIGRKGSISKVKYIEEPFWTVDTLFYTEVNEELVHPKYLYYYLSQIDFNYYNEGTTIPSLRTETLNKILIQIPTLKIQNRIVSVIEKLDLKCVSNEKINRKLGEISKTLFKHWFIDFNFPNEEGLTYKSNGGKMKESELGEIPEGWRIVTIGDVCNANQESLSKKDQWEYINYLDTGNITKNRIDNIQLIDVSKDKVPSRAKRKIKSNDIVFSTVRPNQQHYGIIKEPLENMIVSTGFVVLSSKGMYSNDLIYLWITQEEVLDSLQAIAEQSTSAYPSIKPDDILSLKILLPSKRLLELLTKVIEVQNNLIWNNQQENKKLSEIRDTLLPKLLSGEIEIPDESVVD